MRPDPIIPARCALIAVVFVLGIVPRCPRQPHDVDSTKWFGRDKTLHGLDAESELAERERTLAGEAARSATLRVTTVEAQSRYWNRW
jgi:hypothetical protein